MIPTLTKITIRQLSEDYDDQSKDGGGIVGFGGKLDIRPPYQREFVYSDEQRDAVIDTVMKNCPLNVMYWSVRDDGKFEIIDGQQRTISICEYVTNVFTLNDRYFHSYVNGEEDPILDYELMIYLCEGTDKEKLDWFRTINIAGEELTDQELLNAVYFGPWVSDAKKRFSKKGCAASDIGSDYLKGIAIRQDYLETAIKWINNDKVERYMSKHHHDTDALELWNYFENVINWVAATFTKSRKEMKGVDWNWLYKKYKNIKHDPVKIEAEVAKLMADYDVKTKPGIYRYVLTRDPRDLEIRGFNPNQRREAFERQKGVCVKCGKKFKLDEMHADHIKPWSKGGKTVSENCQMLCQKDNAIKSNK